MQKYRVSEIVDYQTYRHVVMSGRSGVMNVCIERQLAGSLRPGDKFRIIYNKEGAHMAYVFNSSLVLPMEPSSDAQVESFMRDIGARGRAVCRIALARALRARGIFPSLSAANNLRMLLYQPTGRVHTH